MAASVLRAWFGPLLLMLLLSGVGGRPEAIGRRSKRRFLTRSNQLQARLRDTEVPLTRRSFGLSYRLMVR